MSGAFHPPASRPLRRWLHADERGSVVAESDAAGAAVATYAYGPWGELDTTAGGRFRYTGQALIPELGLYYYKARMYSAYLGRFLQTDPAGYADGLNLYAYAGGDPINATDPSGLEDEYFLETIFVLGNKQKQEPLFVGLTITGGSLFNFGGSGGDAGGSSSGKDKPAKEKPKKGCSAGGAARRASLNALASNLGPVTFDSASEVGLLAQYFRGDTTPYRLSGAEMAQARAYVGTYGNTVLGSAVRTGADGTTERSIFFGKIASAAPLLDGLLGTATGIFRGGDLVGIRDTFNFDFKDRGGYPYGTFANAGVAMIRADAATCAGNVSIPISGG